MMGYRGRPALHEAAAVKALVGLCNLIADAGNRIASIDVNPFLINSKFGVAVDGLIVLNNEAARKMAKHWILDLRAMGFRMTRRDFLIATTATVVNAGAHAAAQTPATSPSNLRAAARQAWIWGLPLIEFAQQRSARHAEGMKANTLKHQRALIAAKDQFVTTPNNDTLYSHAWLDLEKGPVTVNVPASGERYYCVPLMDMYSNNFAILGTRTTGNAAQSFTIVGPNHAGSGRTIRSPTNWVWMLGRTLVDGESDLAKAHEFQNGWTMQGAEAGVPKTYAKRFAPWQEYFASVQELMNESPPPVTDARILEAMAPLIGFGRSFDSARFSADQATEIQAGISDAVMELMQVRGRSQVQNGWSFPLYGLGDFAQDYTYRAAVAIAGLGALPRLEAIYLRAAGADGRGFDSSKSWELAFAADELPPVDSFWSLSMYRQTADGQLFFTENPINRYAIGDRTPGLKRGADGSLSISMSPTEPASNLNTNWLPAPAEGKFVLILRAYLPKPALIEGRYQPPAVRPV